jgi:predicted nucleic acid-binding protein
VGTGKVIVLDTNVLSELLRATPSPVVLAWARAQDADAIFTTAVCEAEMLFGVAAMAEGRRQMALARAVDAILGTILGGRVLPFDRAAARFYGVLAAECRKAGRSVGIADLQIAAIARARNAGAIATRNTQHFAGCGLAIVDPWSAAAAPASGQT